MIEEILSFFRNYGLQVLATIVIAYLLGSISFSILFTRVFAARKDIRSMGSGNAGATNVLRSVGKLPALCTFVGDFGKGALAITIGKLIFEYFTPFAVTPYTTMQYGAYLAGLFCLIGHIYPCYFGFRGGKGVLTAAAMMLLIDWRVFLIEAAIFALIFLFSHIVSLGSIVAATVYPLTTFLVTFFLDYRQAQGLAASDINLHYVVIATVITLLTGALVVYKHKENIKRLKAGTEKKIF